MGKQVKCICPQCGTVSLADVKEITEDGWLPCSVPGGFEWTLPSGKIMPVVGAPIYVDAVGKQMSYQEFLDKYNVDPELAYTKMRGSMKGGAPKPVEVGGGKPKIEPVQLGRKR